MAAQFTIGFERPWAEALIMFAAARAARAARDAATTAMRLADTHIPYAIREGYLEFFNAGSPFDDAYRARYPRGTRAPALDAWTATLAAAAAASDSFCIVFDALRDMSAAVEQFY